MMEGENGKNYSLSKTMIIGNRSISAGKAQRDGSPNKLPMLRLDSDDKKSPIKTLAKISNTMASIEQSKIKEIEVENVQLGS